MAMLRVLVYFIATFCLSGASAGITGECHENLGSKMVDLRNWLSEKLELGAPKACQHKELEQLLIDFGMAKLECDKQWVETDYEFPTYEYNAWNMMCPKPEPAYDGTTPANPTTDAREETMPTKPREDAKDETTPAKPREDDEEETTPAKGKEYDNTPEKPKEDTRGKKQKEKREMKKEAKGESEQDGRPKTGESCQEKLERLVHRVKNWLTDKLALGAPEACLHNELNLMLTDFGGAKIECDKDGEPTDIVFPEKEYAAWTKMCPEDTPPDQPEYDGVRESWEEERDEETVDSDGSRRKEL